MKWWRSFVYGLMLLYVLLMASFTGNAQEICSNGADDDADGLIDLHDPDCQCFKKEAGNLLQNGSFELYDHCPASHTYAMDSAIAAYWKFATYTNINEAYYYHNLTCAYDSAEVTGHIQPALPLPDGSSFISIYNSSTVRNLPERKLAKTYIGQCLQKPLLKGENYVLNFSVGRFRSWDNYIGNIFPFTLAVFGNADCSAVPFGEAYAMGNGCPANYKGWVLLGNADMYVNGSWVKGKINFTIPFDINVIAIGPDCALLPEIPDLADSTTFLDYHVFCLDDLQLLPEKESPFEYIQADTKNGCKRLPLLKAPVINGASYQWYKDSIAINGATTDTYEVADTTGTHYYNASIKTDTLCIVTKPFLIPKSRLNEVKITSDTLKCINDSILLASAVEGITYTLNGKTNKTVTVYQAGMYNIIATDVYGCAKIFSVHVNEQPCINCPAFIPTAFTPNGDGLNDLFRPKFYCLVRQYHLKIYNRWGRKIFESNDANTGWDGTVSGIKLPGGSYVYLMEYKTASGLNKIAKGMINLIL